MTKAKKASKAEAGRKGGQAVLDKHGHDHMVRLARLGAAARARRTEQLRAAGRKGGLATLARYGIEHMRAIGRQGAAARARNRAKRAAEQTDTDD